MLEQRPHSPYCACDRCSGATDEPQLLAILSAVCSAFRVTHEELLGSDRHERYRRARSAVLLLARELTGLPYPKLCLVIGRSDHRTAMKGLARAQRRLERDGAFQDDLASAREIMAAAG